MLTTEIPNELRMTVAVPWSNSTHASPVTDMEMFEAQVLQPRGVDFAIAAVHPDTWVQMGRTLQFRMRAAVGGFSVPHIRDHMPAGFVHYMDAYGNVVGVIRVL